MKNKKTYKKITAGNKKPHNDSKELKEIISKNPNVKRLIERFDLVLIKNNNL